MPNLLTLKTQFTSLKYSKDRSGGGSSGQPFIQNPIPEQATAEQRAQYEVVRSGATVTSLFNSIDSTRIRDFFKDTVKGQIFGDKQRQLQFQNPKSDVGFQIQLDGNLLQRGLVEFNRIYNTSNLNLLAQIAVQGTGFHLDRAGTIPITPYQSKYFYNVVEKNRDGRNRLELLKTLKIDNTKNVQIKSLTPKQIGLIVDDGVSRSPNRLFEYPGGPNSNDFINFTTIDRTDFTNIWNGTSLRYLKDVEITYRSKQKPVQVNQSSTPTLTPVVLSTLTPAEQQKYNSLLKQGELVQVFRNDKGELVSQAAVGTGGDAVVTSTKKAKKVPVPALEALWQTVYENKVAVGGTFFTIKLPTGVTQQGSNQILVKRYDDTFKEKSIEGTTIGTLSPINRPTSLTYSGILNQQAGRDIKGLNPNSNILPDFRINVPGQPSGSDYQGVNGEGYMSKVIGTGNPGSKTIDRTYYGSVGNGNNTDGVDQINALDVGKSINPEQRDLIKCQFATVQTDSNGGRMRYPAIPIVFRAFVTDLSDTYTADYQAHQYVGRGEKFYTYNVGDRKVSFNLKVAAQSRREMRPLYRKLNYLVSQTYPRYSSSNRAVGDGFMRPPLMKVTIGDYLADVPGFMTSAAIKVTKDSPWEIALDPTGQDIDVQQLPHYLELTINFVPIHNFLPMASWWSSAGPEITEFIGNDYVNSSNPGIQQQIFRPGISVNMEDTFPVF